MKYFFIILQIFAPFSGSTPSEQTQRHAEQWVNAMKSQMDYYPSEYVPSFSWDSYIYNASGQIRHYDDYDYLYEIASQDKIANMFDGLKDGSSSVDRSDWEHFWQYLLCQLKGEDCLPIPNPTGAIGSEYWLLFGVLGYGVVKFGLWYGKKIING